MPWRPLPAEDDPEPRRVSESLDRVTSAIGMPDAGVIAALFGRWEEIVGARVAGHARPVSLSGGTLTIACDHPGWATELGFLEEEILGRVGRVAGPGAVGRLAVRVER